MKKTILSVISICIFSLCFSQNIVAPAVWLRADSAVLGDASWHDVSGNGFDATPSSGAMPSAFSRMNFNERPQNLSYGKSFTMNRIFLNQDDYTDYAPPVFHPSISILRNDTVFCYDLFYTENVIDSISLQYYSVKKKRGGKYIRSFNDGCIWIIRYKKVKTHSFHNIEMLNLMADKIVEPRSIFRYNTEGKKTEYFISFCGFSFSKRFLNSTH